MSRVSVGFAHCPIGKIHSTRQNSARHTRERNAFQPPTLQSLALLSVIIASMFGKAMAAIPQAPMFFNITPVVVSAASSSEEQEEIKVIVERNVPVPMRDGTILRADVHRPDRGGPYPVLVERTQYSKGGNYDRFVKAGYIVVDQDVRGRYQSEGQFESYHRVKIYDAQDGYDTVEWAAKLPSATGKVGVMGYSDLGMRQWPLAALRPASLKAMSASHCIASITDITQGSSRPLSIRSFMPLESRRRNNRPGVHMNWEAKKLWEEDSKKWTWWLPWSELPQDFYDDMADAIKYLVKNPSFDPLKLDNCCKEIVVPNLAIYGWFDFTAGGDILLFQKMVKEAKSEVARQGSRLIVGPWSHASFGRRIGSIDFGPHAEIDEGAMRIRWFDYWLKDKPNGVDKDPPVRIFVMGDNQWRGEQGWPLHRAKEKTLYIMSDGHANTPSGSGCLAESAPHEAGTDQYEYDPSNPILSPYIYSPSPIMFPSDQRRLASRQDVLVYQTEPLVERTEITGEPVVDLYATSSAPDTDWVVRLIDVCPDGLAVDVSQGFIRARYRNGLDKPEVIKPGEVVKYVIRMRPTSNAFLPDHRIRLDITSSDFPNYDRNHNTAADQYADATLVTAQQTIHHGGQLATRVILPWVPNAKERKGTTEKAKPKQPLTYRLHQAVSRGNVVQIKRLLSDSTLLNSEDPNGYTPLCNAVKVGRMDIVQLLVDVNADINAGKWPPLYVAVDVNDITIARYLIAHGANANPVQRWRPLQQVPYSSSVEMAELLIDNGADMNFGRYKVWEVAIDEDRMDIMELLIRKGMDVNTVDERGMSLLGYAVTTLKQDILDFLLANGAEIPQRKNKMGLTPLHNAAIQGQEKIADFLLAKGAKVDERDDNYEFTALHYAARFGTTKVAEVLIAHGADIKAKDKWAYEPIHWAAYHDRPEIIELLIAKGADVNIKTFLGQTPLELAIPRRNTGAIEVLRKHGAKE